MDYTVLKNERHSPEDFKMDHPCDFCTKFSGQVIEVWTKYIGPDFCQGSVQSSVRVCKTCLERMSGILDSNMVEEMKKRKHRLYETGDKDVPRQIVDSNGEVVLALCRVCGGGEASLPTNCPGRKLTSDEMDKIQDGELDF